MMATITTMMGKVMISRTKTTLTSIEYLIALSLFAHDYHGGQVSRLYRIGCLADYYLLKWFQIRSSEDWIRARYIHTRAKIRVFKIKYRLVTIHT